MNHYCTYFDRNFLIQGKALAASLARHDPASVLWVLCLDDFTHDYFREENDPRIRTVRLADLEAADPALAAVKSRRTRVEYYFTLSPAWPRHLLQTQPAIDRITYVDADMLFFASPQALLDDMAEASVLVTEHRYPPHLAHHLRYGRFNVGILSFRNDPAGLGCLDRWYEQCLAWCHDTVEGAKYADQGYLTSWPEELGEHLHISNRPGVNLAPWNWSTHRASVRDGQVHVENFPLELFHFARFRPQFGSRVFQSGQLEYGIMPWSLRQAIYGPYWQALADARQSIRARRPGFGFARRSLRSWHGFWKAIGPRLLFGSDWLSVGPYFISGRFGLGRFSSRLAHYLRTRRPGHTATPFAPLAGESPRPDRRRSSVSYAERAEPAHRGREARR